MSAVATLDRSPEVEAKRTSPCSFCGEPMKAGQHYICKVEGKGWMHGSCANAYEQLREIYRADCEDEA